MEDEIREILMNLNRGRKPVTEALTELLVIFNVGRSLPTDEEINNMVQWLDKRCQFNDHQKDYVFFGIKDMAKKVSRGEFNKGQ